MLTINHGVRIFRRKHEFVLVLLASKAGTTFNIKDRDRMLFWVRTWLQIWTER